MTAITMAGLLPHPERPRGEFDDPHARTPCISSFKVLDTRICPDPRITDRATRRHLPFDGLERVALAPNIDSGCPR